MRSAENVTCRPVLRSAPGVLRSIMPAMTAHLANVAFISVRFAEPALQIVAQHVLVEQRREIEIAHRLQPPHRHGVFAGEEAERMLAQPLEPARDQHAERLLRQAVPRTDSRRDSAWRRAETSRSAFRPAPARRSGAAASRSSRAPAAAAPSAARARAACGARGRRGRSRAETCRRRRRESSGSPARSARTTSASRSRTPIRRRISPANRKVSPGARPSMKYSSICPSRRPGTSGRGPSLCGTPGRGRTPARTARRTSSISDSMMAPTFMRCCCATEALRARQRPVLQVLHDAPVAVVGAQRIAAGGDKIDGAVELRARQIGVGRR